MRRKNNNTVFITNQNITGKHRCIATPNRHIKVIGLMQRQVGRRRRARVICMNGKFSNAIGIPETTISHDPLDATLHQTGYKDRSRRCRARVLAAVHHQNMSLRALLDSNALRVVWITEHLNRITIFACGDIAQRIGLPNHIFTLRGNLLDILDELIANAALKKGRT